jgi:FixJ family two-component response regulator
VVLDLQMSGPSGLELQEALAQAEQSLALAYRVALGELFLGCPATNEPRRARG